MRQFIVVCLMLPWLFFAIQPVHAEDSDLEDRALISQQVAKYAQLWDRKDAEAFSELFSEDGVIEWQFTNALDQPPSIGGRSEILSYARHAHQTRLAGRQSRHHFSGLVFEELTNTQALTEHIFMVTHHVPGETPVLVTTGLYRIAWVKTDQNWLMTNRKLIIDR